MRINTMTQLTQLTNEIYNENKKDAYFISRIANHHAQGDKYGNFVHYLAFGKYPIKYCFKEKTFIDNAKKTYSEMKQKRILEIEKSKKIHFVAMGCDFDNVDGFINNHRIRCNFYNNKNKLIFLEVGSSRNNKEMRVDFSLDVRKDKYNLFGVERTNKVMPYTYDYLLKFVNDTYDCNFTGIEIERNLVSCDDFINSI